jgi:hypothetical protein
MPLSDADLKARQEALASLGVTVDLGQRFAAQAERQARRDAVPEADRLRMQINGLVGGVLMNQNSTEATVSAAIAKAAVLQNRLAELEQ